MRRRLTGTLAVVAAMLLAGGGLAGCATADSGVATEDNPAALGTSATSPPVTSPVTSAVTVPPTAVTLPPTTLAPTTTLPPLPVPQAPPLDAGSPGAQLGSIEIPKIGLSLPLFDGVNTATLDEGGAGHWPGTARPGTLGNVVVAAHRVSHGAPFRKIDKLVVGDQVLFTLNGQTATYQVTETDVVPPEAIDIITQTMDHTATLFACHPPGSTKFRYVVKLRQIA